MKINTRDVARLMFIKGVISCDEYQMLYAWNENLSPDMIAPNYLKKQDAFKRLEGTLLQNNFIERFRTYAISYIMNYNRKLNLTITLCAVKGKQQGSGSVSMTYNNNIEKVTLD